MDEGVSCGRVDVEGLGDGGEVGGREVECVEPGISDSVVEEGKVGFIAEV